MQHWVQQQEEWEEPFSSLLPHIYSSLFSESAVCGNSSRIPTRGGARRRDPRPGTSSPFMADWASSSDCKPAGQTAIFREEKAAAGRRSRRGHAGADPPEKFKTVGWCGSTQPPPASLVPGRPKQDALGLASTTPHLGHAAEHWDTGRRGLRHSLPPPCRVLGTSTLTFTHGEDNCNTLPRQEAPDFSSSGVRNRAIGRDGLSVWGGITVPHQWAR